MVEVVKVKRKSAALSPSSLECLAQLPTVNVSLGCAHGCLYCYTRGYSGYPGENRVEVYENLLDLLQKELPRKKIPPAAVYFSPSSDVFQPVPEVLEIGYHLFEYLLTQGVGIAFLTKGEIPARHLKLFAAHPKKVRAQIGLITLEERILKTFEPQAAGGQARLAQIKKLIQAGVKTQVRLDPVLPGLTDDEATLGRLLAAVAEAGVTQIAASVLFLRPAIIASLSEHLQDQQMCDRLIGHFSQAKRLSIHAEKSSVMALPSAQRAAILNRVNSLAKQFGIRVKTCACKNPDLASGTCSIAGEWIKPRPPAGQLRLFDRPERSD